MILFPLLILVDAIGLILPKYIPSVHVLKLLLINTYIITIPLYQILILGSAKIKKQNLINISIATTGTINLCLSILMIKFGYGINGVAFSTVLSNLILVIMYFVFAHKYYLETVELWFYLKIIIPLISLIVILTSNINIFDSKGGCLLQSVVLTLSACLLFIIFYRLECIFAFENVHKYLKRGRGD
jgi:hypothetical protein